jgi:ATP-dependent helicase HrpA
VYPALKDAGDGVEIVELDAPLLAEHETRKGALRLLALALAQQMRFARKRFADRNELALLASVTLPAVRIADRLAERVIMDAFLPEEQATPRTREQFDAVITGGRDRFAQALDRLEVRALEMLGELKAVRQKLRALTAPACKAAVADIEQQLAGLLPQDFLERTPQSRLTQFPRYLKALGRRLDRLPAGASRDAELLRVVEPFIREWQGLRLAAGGPVRAGLLPELAMLRWMIEEFRVSLFAQDLRTAIPVSPQRMAAQLEKARQESAKD